MAEERKDSLVGQILGAYQLVEPLGKGGMATVYKAYETALDRYVAVKVLSQTLAADENFIQRFRREAKLIAQLSHPNIVPVYSFGEEKNIIYIAMQLVEGGTLRHEPGQAIPIQDALRLLAPIARALGFAHQRGIIHRDVKPSNILLSAENWPMMADFGLARTAEQAANLTGTGASMGTPLYMSPEQCQAEKLDQRTDIYSLGIVLYELVTGDAPFHADTPMAVIIKHVTTPIPSPRQLNPQIPEDVERIILKATAKSPADRYKTAEEMAEAMESARDTLTTAPQGKITPATIIPLPAQTVKVAEKTIGGNPFTFGNPIKDPARFYGRSNEIRQIINRLASSAHESTSVIGERRIGKTSLLSYLSNQSVAASLGLAPEHFCLVYVDFQGLTDITPQRFWQRVLNKMVHSICDESLKPDIQALSKQESFDLFDLEDVFQSASDNGFTTVLFMDEFEYVTQNPNFKSDFFGGLRALAIHSGVALIPATRRELVDLCHSDEIKGSPFFNIFANVVLRPFSQAEVTELINGYTQDTPYAFTPDESAIVHNLGGGYPFFVQAAGHYVMEAKLQGLSAEVQERFVIDNFDQQADPHYAYMWSHCSESEKITLLILLTLGVQKASRKTIPNLENLTNLRARAPQDLVTMGKRGLIAEQDGLYSIFSPSFVRWVSKEILAAPGEEESKASADEWVKSGGEKDVKAAAGMFPKFKRKYWPILADVAKELSFEFAAAGAMELLKLIA